MIIELRTARDTARRLGRPLAGYSEKQLNEELRGLSQRSLIALDRAPAHIAVRMLENRLRKNGIKPQTENETPIIAPAAPAPAVTAPALQPGRFLRPTV